MGWDRGTEWGTRPAGVWGEEEEGADEAGEEGWEGWEVKGAEADTP